MKKKFTTSSPFSQATIVLVIGSVTFLILSIIVSLIGSALYPETAGLTPEAMIKTYPILFMMVNYFPFQVGFLMTPGILYVLWSEKSLQIVHKPHISKLIWSVLLFVTLFFLIPFLTEVNLNIAGAFGWREKLLVDKDSADQFMQTIVGAVGSNSFLVSILIIGVITGIAEELAFRRFLFHHLLKNTHQLGTSLIFSAFIFTILHFNYIQIIPLFGFGLALGLVYYVSGRIWVGMVLHALNNALNIWWLATDSYPKWMETFDTRISIPATLVLLLLILYFSKKIGVLKEIPKQ